jgi:RNA polymerase sigma factor (sigma-70 family)
LHKKGSIQQAEDIFQDGLMIAYRKLLTKELNLSCKFSTFLYSICKRLWIQERRKWFIQQEKLKERPLMVQDSGHREHAIDQKTLRDLIYKHLDSMSPECQKVIRMSLNDCSSEEIRKALDFKTVDHAIDRKYRCKKGLINRILSDPLFKRLKDEIR